VQRRLELERAEEELRAHMAETELELKGHSAEIFAPQFA
jgi:hypothetical protein